MIFRGMEMVKKQLDEFLRGQGVEEIAAEGERFDPNLHEAVSEEEAAEVDEGRVLRVVRRGYRMHDRLLRPASVVVAKAPEAERAAGEEGDDH
jgi:molecular chaperone GrpE